MRPKDEIIKTESEIREEHDRSSPKSIGEYAEHRREKKLHQCEDGAENTEPLRRARSVAPEKIQNQLGQHRRNQSERKHVERDGDENKDDGGFTWFQHHLRVVSLFLICEDLR